MTKPLVNNGDDEKQVMAAAEKERHREIQKVEDARAVMSTAQGRRFVWNILTHCRPFGSIWESSAKIHYNSGKQDVGHFIIGYVENADQDSFFKMMIEAKENANV